MKNRALNKKGFSVSELLMVVLVLSLIICIIGGGIVVVKNAYERITLKAEAQTLLSTTITAVTDEFRFARDIDLNPDNAGTTAEAPITFVSANLGCVICLDNDTEGKRGIIIRNPINNDTADLLSDKTMSSGLVTEIRGSKAGGDTYAPYYTYDAATGTFAANIVVRNSSGDIVISQDIKVRTINKVYVDTE